MGLTCKVGDGHEHGNVVMFLIKEVNHDEHIAAAPKQ